MRIFIGFLSAAGLAAISAYAGEIDTNAFVTAHNKWRTEAGVKEELSYSPALAATAQAWANTLKQTNQCRMRHSKPSGQYGENLYWASAMTWSDGRLELQKVTPEKVVNSWAGEMADYDYANNRCAPGKVCGHYTQVVWRTTRMVGCAMAVCEDTKDQIWVCQYQPAGNWAGRKPY